VTTQTQTPFEEQLGYLLAELGKVVLAKGDEILAPLGLTGKSLRVLEMATREPLSQQQLAAGCGVDRTTMVAIVDDFERLGLAVRQRDQADRRRYVVAPTDAGLAAVRAGRAAVAAAENEFLADLGPDERVLLRQVAANVLRRLGPPSC
jgi:DNA-binding MarR family transcriptional regulator